MSRGTLLLWAGFVVLALSREAAAGDAAAAAQAFAEGQRALFEADYDRAADRFELADSIIPSKEALRSAVRAHMHGGHLARAASLSELLLERYPDDATSVGLANQVLAEATQALVRVQLTCEAGCTVSLGGLAVSIAKARRHVFFLPPGERVLEIAFGRRLLARRIATEIGVDLTLEVEAPPPEQPPALEVRSGSGPKPAVVRERRGLPRLVPILGISLTLASAGIASWSALDTRKAHDDYVSMPTHQEWLDGRSKQLRTNILWGVTAGLSAITLATAFWTEWRGASESPSLGLAPSDRDVMLVFSSPF